MLDLYLTFSWSRSLINKIREFVNGGRQHRKISSSQCNWARVSLQLGDFSNVFAMH